MALFQKNPKLLIKPALFVLAFGLASCVTVRQADLDAWNNVPVIELESHPVFNAMELQKKTLSDGSTLWSYTKQPYCLYSPKTDLCKYTHQSRMTNWCL